MNVALFGERVWPDDQVMVRSSGWALIQHDCVLIERGNVDTDTHTRTPYEHAGRYHGDEPTCQGNPKD